MLDARRGQCSDTSTSARRSIVHRAGMESGSPVRVLGSAGSAAGMELRVIACPALSGCDTDAAIAACRLQPGCDTVELQRFSSADTRAVLRSSYRTWGSNVRELRSAARRCRRLSLKALKINVTSRTSYQDKRAWHADFCDELSSPGRMLPPLGRGMPQESLEGTLYRPARSTSFLIVLYADRPTRWLCSFLRTMAYGWTAAGDEVELVILGWRPEEFRRANVLYYTMDRIYCILAFLQQAASHLAPDVPVMYLDSDQLMQVTLPQAMLTARGLIDRAPRAAVVFAAERRCAPFKLQQNESLLARRLLGREFQPLGPHCLNSGSFVGTKQAVVRALQSACHPCARSGTSASSIAWRYYDVYSARAQTLIYNDQSVLMRTHLALSNASKLTLDYEQRLFHTNFGFLPKKVMQVAADGRLRNRVTGSMAAFMHYNGNTKASWRGSFAPSALAKALGARVGGAAQQRDQLQALMTHGKIVVVGRRRFDRVTGVSLETVCEHDGTGIESYSPPAFNAKAWMHGGM